MNGPMFLAYVKQCLVPTLKRGEIVLMDHLPIHKVAGVAEAYRSSGRDPRTQRMSSRTFRPSLQPNSLSLCTNAPRRVRPRGSFSPHSSGRRLAASARPAVHAPPAAMPLPRRFPSPLEKYLGEVRLQRFGIGRLTAEADIAVGTDHIQTCTPSSIAMV